MHTVATNYPSTHNELKPHNCRTYLHDDLPDGGAVGGNVEEDPWGGHDAGMGWIRVDLEEDTSYSPRVAEAE